MDSKGNNGTFTLIYDEGVEVRINGLVFFAFSYYQQTSSGVVSVCNATFPGWFHTFDINQPTAPATQWGCFVATMNSATAASMTTAPIIDDRNRLNKKFHNDKRFIKAINAAQSDWTATSYPQFEGLTIGQMERRAGGSRHIDGVIAQLPRTAPNLSRLPSQVPKAWDWRNVGGVNYVSPVRDQGGCGSCYAFASMAMLEARIRYLSNNTQTPILSPQNILGCSEYAQACEGGWPFLTAGKYGHDFGHVEEKCFPYTGTDSKCALSCPSPTRWMVGEYMYVGGYYGDSTVAYMEGEIYKNGPLAVSFLVYNDFFGYQKGVYSHNGTADLLTFNPFVLVDHSVLIVGWGHDDSSNLDYWIVKNSWGESWGMSGYFWIRKGTPIQGGECGIESISLSAIPILQSDNNVQSV